MCSQWGLCYRFYAFMFCLLPGILIGWGRFYRDEYLQRYKSCSSWLWSWRSGENRLCYTKLAELSFHHSHIRAVMGLSENWPKKVNLNPLNLTPSPPPQSQKPGYANVIIYYPGLSVVKRFCDMTAVSSLLTFCEPNDVENVFCL